MQSLQLPFPAGEFSSPCQSSAQVFEAFFNSPEQQLHVVVDAAAELLLEGGRHGVHRRRQGPARRRRRRRGGQSGRCRCTMDFAVDSVSVRFACDMSKFMNLRWVEGRNMTCQHGKINEL